MCQVRELCAEDVGATAKVIAKMASRSAKVRRDRSRMAEAFSLGFAERLEMPSQAAQHPDL
jgi:hypothetical protein